MIDLGHKYDADVIIVGAGPAGSAAAIEIARAGKTALVLEKTEFPREKVCGDGLTPRAVTQLTGLGIDTSSEAGWIRHKGLRIIGGGNRITLDWPELADFPNYSVIRTREDLDHQLVEHARSMGAQVNTSTTVTGAVVDSDNRVCGVQAQNGPDKKPITYRAPIVISADGVSGRLALSLGIARRADRPLGVAARRYYRSPRHDDDYLEVWLEVPNPIRPECLIPGYAWIFGMGNGLVNVGVGTLGSVGEDQINYRALLDDFVSQVPSEWEMNSETAIGPTRGAAIPMGFNRTPPYRPGLLLVGDTAGAVNPFNGEGISYALETGSLAARLAVQALARSGAHSREQVLAHYPTVLKENYGGYYLLGRYFTRLISHPAVMRVAAERGLAHPGLLAPLLKVASNLTDRSGGAMTDPIVGALTKMIATG